MQRKRQTKRKDSCMPGILLSNRRPEWCCFVDSLLFALLYRPSYYVVNSLMSADVETETRDMLLQLAKDINGSNRARVRQLPDGFFRSFFGALKNDFSLLSDFEEHLKSDEMPPPFGDVIEVYNGIREAFSFQPLTTLKNDLHTFETQLALNVDSNQNVFEKLQEMNLKVKSDTLIIPLNRIGEQKRLTNVQIPPETLIFNNLSEKKVIFNLCAVVNYKGGARTVGHYTCYVRCDNTFYYFDDVEPEVFKEIGSYDDLIKTRSDKVKTQGLLFVYKDLTREEEANKLLFGAPLLPPPHTAILPPVYEEDEDEDLRRAIKESLKKWGGNKKGAAKFKNKISFSFFTNKTK